MRGLIHTECPALDAIRVGMDRAFVDERFIAHKFSDHSRRESYLTLLKSAGMWLAGDITGRAQLVRPFPVSGRFKVATHRKDTSNLGLLT